jgi:hypothetical protein
MKGVNNGGADKNGSAKVVGKKITPENYLAIHRRIDQCLPMETGEWHRLEQLLMQVTEFAPTSLVYQIGMAAAVYADNQAQRAYLLGREDAKREDASIDVPVKATRKSSKAIKAVKANRSVA